MDLDRLDRLARSVATAGSRRSLLGLLAAVPVVGGLAGILSPEDAEAKDRRKRRKKRHKQRKNPGNRKQGCKPQGKGKVCAGRCEPVKNRQTCGKTMDCGSCDCTPPCGECFTCQGAAGAPGTCVPQASGTPCGDAATCSSGTLHPRGSCDGTGTCTPADPVSCAPYTQCDGDACATSCFGDGDCVAGSFCDGGQCFGDLPIGETCTDDGQCASGFCVDDVCCNSACDGACQACNLTGSVGTCTTEDNLTPCGGGNVCCSGSCQECCGHSDCSGSEPVCVSGQCAACSASPGDCPGSTCCDASSGVCAGSCPASAPICVSDICTVCSVSNPCPGGCCASDGSCQTGGSDAACGAVGGTCDVCEATETCTSRTCVAKPCGEGGVCRVFVSSTTQQGTLGGLTGADAICQGLAQAASLPGTYKAWLSDATGSPSTSFVQSTGPYQRLDGVTVANNWADLTDGTLQAPINRTDTGGTTTPVDPTRFAWTNTAPDGTVLGGQDCDTWSSNEGTPDGWRGVSGTSIFGNGSEWTNILDYGCDNVFRLYCFQQSS